MRAREVEYDIGYLAATRRAKENPLMWVQDDTRTPPNFGRYVNTAVAVGENNCEFVTARDGFDAMFVDASREIKLGEEVLVPYGDSFVIPGADHAESEEETATVCSLASDDDQLEIDIGKYK